MNKAFWIFLFIITQAATSYADKNKDRNKQRLSCNTKVELKRVIIAIENSNIDGLTFTRYEAILNDTCNGLRMKYSDGNFQDVQCVTEQTDSAKGSWHRFYSHTITGIPVLTPEQIIKAKCNKITQCIAISDELRELETYKSMFNTLGCTLTIAN